MTEITEVVAPPKGSTGNGSGTTTTKAKTPKVKAPKVFGGEVGAPEMGANSRRTWRFLKGQLPKTKLRAIRKNVLEATPATDRFVRWQRIVAAAQSLDIALPPAEKGGEPQPINQALVRKLQAEDKDGKIGRDRSITFTV